VKEHTRCKPVRKPLPAELPRVEIEIVPPEVEREPDAFECIGSETREVLERRPAAVVAVKLVYKKFARKDRERGGETEVLVGETVELPIERGSAGPGFLADTIVRRWQDHQPLNRLEGVYARDGLDLSRSTLCTWHGELGGLARPVYEAMFIDALSSPVPVRGCNRSAGAGQGALPQWALLGAGGADDMYCFATRRATTGRRSTNCYPGTTGIWSRTPTSVYDHCTDWQRR